VDGGCRNIAGTNTSVSGTCASSGLESILGGENNLAEGNMSAIAGGEINNAVDPYSVVVGGCANTSGGPEFFTCDAANGATLSGAEVVLGGAQNLANAFTAAVGGGKFNGAETGESMILGGDDNTTSTTNCQTFPATGQSC
jgi:hypothetical protein